MFARRFFAARFFARRYFPGVGAAPAALKPNRRFLARNDKPRNFMAEAE